MDYHNNNTFWDFYFPVSIFGLSLRCGKHLRSHITLGIYKVQKYSKSIKDKENVIGNE